MDGDGYFSILTRTHHNAPLALATPPLSFAAKHSPSGQVYLRQPHTIEIIQLDEVDAPPPRTHPSNMSYTTSAPSSSTCSDSEVSDSSSDEDEAEDETTSSYCSSDEEDMQSRNMPFYDDTYGIRLNRVLAWREGFSKSAGGVVSSSKPFFSPTSLQKRKVDYDEDAIDDSTSSSHSSKRSRSHSPERRVAAVPPTWTHRRMSAHSCPACDQGFHNRQSLEQHGQDPQNTDACREAVQYDLES